MTRNRRIILGVLVGVTALVRAAPLSTQQAPPLAPGQRVRVTARSAGLVGAVSTVTALSQRDITLALEPAEESRPDTVHVTVPLDSLGSVEVSTRRYTLGYPFALAGAFVGVAAGYLIGARRPCDGLVCYNAEGGMLIGAFLGAIGGAVVGGSFVRDVWLPVDLHRARAGLFLRPGGRLGIGGTLQLRL